MNETSLTYDALDGLVVIFARVTIVGDVFGIKQVVQLNRLTTERYETT